MRILFTFIGGRGHFDPLVPLAHAAGAAGHHVAVAGSGNQVPAIEAAGFTAFATSEPRPRSQPRPQVRLGPIDPESEERQLREGFARRGGRRHAAAILDIARDWHPDLIVRDEVDFGAAIAAEALGIAYATLLVLAAGTFLRPEIVAEPLHELRAEYGLTPDPELAMLHRHLVLSPFPPTFRDPAAPLPATAFSYRPTTVNRVTRSTDDTPTVYFTLGTVYASTELMSRVIAALRNVEANAIVTVGRSIDPAMFGPQPDHLRIEHFIPQAELLPRADLVVSHAGSGTLMGALAHGLPSILFPMGADQPHNARRCTELGAAVTLDPTTATPDEIRAAVSSVLSSHPHREAAQRIQQEINALPSVEQAVQHLGSIVP